MLDTKETPLHEDVPNNDKSNPTIEDIKSESAPLSKSALKKKLKMEKLKQHWEEKKKLKKQLKKEKAKISKKDEEADNGPSPEERLRLKELHKQERAQWLVDLKTAPRILIDLDFQDLMRPNEISSLVQQLMYSYAFIKRAKKPLRLVLTSVKDEIKRKLEKIKGFDAWLAERYEDCVDDVNNTIETYHYPKDKMIYLSADAEETLEKLENDKVYIIGGIVDRNRYKNLTFEKAQRLGYKCAKLPLNLVKFHGSRVLTVNNVVELLVRFHNQSDWEKAIHEGVPLRKMENEEKS